jgi:sugar (pentulose or hexulose) kinase
MIGLLLGIDVGTYSSKGVLVEANGTLVKTTLAEHEMSVPHPGSCPWGSHEAQESLPRVNQQEGSRSLHINCPKGAGRCLGIVAA